MTAPKVGDVRRWKDVPNGAMVREETEHATVWCVRVRGLGAVVHVSGCGWRPFTLGWEWDELADPTKYVTIVALGLTGQETAADLQRLAEVFEVREALAATPCMECGGPCACWGICEGRLETLGPMCDEHCGHGGEDGWCTMSGPRYDEQMRRLAERLRDLGWRKGQTVKEAAALLQEADR